MPSEVWGPLHYQLLPGHCLAQCLCGSHCRCFPSPSPDVTEMVFPGPSTPSSPPILLSTMCLNRTLGSAHHELGIHFLPFLLPSTPQPKPPPPANLS